jgi:polar amino acid transport system substrate-binding protein
MPIHIKQLLTAFLCSISMGLAANALEMPLKGAVVKACDDDAEFPPFTYYERDAENKKTQNIAGFAVDLASDILTKQGAILDLQLVPWKRCQKQLENGKLAELALNVTSSPDRQKNYLFSESIYEASGSYFYSKDYYPNGLKIENISDLSKYKICGLFGYDYSAYGLNDQSPNLDSHAKKYSEIAYKIHNKSCDIFIEKTEVVEGQAKLGQILIKDNNRIASAKLPEKTPEKFYFMISKKSEKAETLLKVLNQGIDEMKKNGEMNKLMSKYSLSRQL